MIRPSPNHLGQWRTFLWASDRVNSVAFGPDGTRIVSGSVGTEHCGFGMPRAERSARTLASDGPRLSLPYPFDVLLDDRSVGIRHGAAAHSKVGFEEARKL